MKKKRSQLEIIHDMLSSVQEKGGTIKPTHLMYKSNLSYKLMQEYVELLLNRGLLEEDGEEKKKYVITEKGRTYLFEYRRMAEFTDAFGL